MLMRKSGVGSSRENHLSEEDVCRLGPCLKSSHSSSSAVRLGPCTPGRHTMHITFNVTVENVTDYNYQDFFGKNNNILNLKCTFIFMGIS